MEKETKKGIIWLIVILIILVIGLASYIIYEKFIKVEYGEYGTKEELIKQNFLNDIDLVKKGRGGIEQKYLMCDDIYKCENIGAFYIDNVEFYENGEDNQPVYKIKLSWNCKNDGACFYNEQYGYNEETKLNEIETFYRVDENNNIIECLGNLYGFAEEDDDSYNILYEAEWKGTAFDLLEKANIDEYSNFKGKKIKIGKIDFTLNCTGYNLVGGNACDEFEILVNDKSNNIKSSVEVETYLMVAGDVVVVSSGGYMGTMKVISDSGNRIYENEIVMSYRKNYTGFNDGDGTPTLIDGKLYFYTQKDENTITKNYLDLNNNFKLVKQEEIEGYIGEY